MASRVVIALYRALLRSTQILQRDMEARHTLYDAIRSSVVTSYDGIKADWQRERMFVRRFEDMKVLKQCQSDRNYVAIVRAAFVSPLEMTRDARIDAAFEALKRVDDHNALIHEFKNQRLYEPKVRTNVIQYLIGDVVRVKGESRGVIFAWHVATDTEEAAAQCRVTYDILPHSPGLSFASKLYNVPQNEIQLDESPTAVAHPALLLYFDSFDGTHHVPSTALATRYPSDVATKWKDVNTIVAIPSIHQLQRADEDKLLTYLRCEDSTIVQFAAASLEGIWIGENGLEARDMVQRALMLAHQKKYDEAREVLNQVVQDSPAFAYAWNKLATVEYQSGNYKIALGHFETAIKLKPHFVEALVGLGTCATRLQRWTDVHRAAVQLIDVQPSHETAKLLFEQAIFATL